MDFVKVILPLKLAWCPVYKAPEGTAAGQRVKVIFARREYSGVVCETGVSPDVAESRIQEILGVEEGLPCFSPEEIRFWQFLADYYMCSPGEVFKAACPEGKLRSEKIAAGTAQRAQQARERTAAAARENIARRIARLRERLQKKREAAGAKKPGTKGREALENDIARLEKELEDAAAAARALEAQAAPEPETGAPKENGAAPAAAKPSAGAPEVIIADRRAEEYSKLAAEALAAGSQVLLLTSEKAFCTSLGAGLPDAVCYSSDLTAAARRKISDKVRSGEPLLILGTRSALWLPWRSLGLIIVDEEQDTFHKQTEPAPRIHARDAAVALGGIHGARVVLGTACPSLETAFNLLSGRYKSCGAAAVQKNAATVIDIAAERRKNGMNGALSRILIRRIAATEGRVVLVRGWENPEEVRQLLSELFPGRRDIDVLSLQELKKQGCAGAALLSVLQADAMVSRDDFRADERAVQLVSQLCAMCPEIIVQTAVPDRFTTARTHESLLQERRAFGYPPFRRMVDVTLEDNSPERLAQMTQALRERLAGCLAADDTMMPGAAGAQKTVLRILLRRDGALQTKKSAMAAAIADFERENRYAGHITADADPQ